MRRQVDTGHLHAPRQQNTDHWDMGDGQPPVSVWFDLFHAGMGARCTLSPPPLQVLVSEEGTCPPRIPLVALSPQPVSLDHQYLLVRSAKLMAYYTTNRRLEAQREQGPAWVHCRAPGGFSAPQLPLQVDTPSPSVKPSSTAQAGLVPCLHFLS